MECGRRVGRGGSQVLGATRWPSVWRGGCCRTGNMIPWFRGALHGGHGERPGPCLGDKLSSLSCSFLPMGPPPGRFEIPMRRVQGFSPVALGPKPPSLKAPSLRSFQGIPPPPAGKWGRGWGFCYVLPSKFLKKKSIITEGEKLENFNYQKERKKTKRPHII